MEKLHIVIDLETDIHEQEVVDKLIDGLIDHIGTLKDFVVNNLTTKTSTSYDIKAEIT